MKSGKGRQMFRGYTNDPTYLYNPVEGTAMFALKMGGLLDITPVAADRGLVRVELSAVDYDAWLPYDKRDTMKRYLTIALTSDKTAVSPILTTDDIVSYELFDLNGRRFDGKSVNGQIYLMRATDRNGRQHTMKVIKK